MKNKILLYDSFYESLMSLYDFKTIFNDRFNKDNFISLAIIVFLCKNVLFYFKVENVKLKNAFLVMY